MDLQASLLRRERIAALLGCAAVLFWSLAGLIANPDFAVGEAASSELVFGVDMNGWHAVSGFVVVVPVLIALGWPSLLPYVQAAAAAGIWGTAVWALLTEYPFAGLFYFPNPTGDVILHVATGIAFVIGAVAGFRRLALAGNATADAPRPG